MRPAPSAPAASPAAPPGPSLGLLAGPGLAGLAVITLAHPSATRLHAWPWALAAALLWLAPAAALVARGLRHDSLALPPLPLSLGLGVLAVAAVASAWASPFATLSLARTWPTLGGVALLFLLHDRLVRTAQQEALSRAIAWMGAVIACASLAGWTLQVWPSFHFPNTVPFGHPNYTAGVLVALVPWLVRRIPVSPLGWGAATLVAVLALIGTGSRGGVLALAVVAAGGAVWAVLIAPWSRGRKCLLLGAVAVAAIAAILANPRLRDLVLHRGWNDVARESNRQRSAMLQGGVRLGVERPALGWGPGAVPLAYPQVRRALDGGADNVLQLHSTPVQLWATLSAAGLLALLLLLAGALQAVKNAPHTPSALAAAASLGAYGIFSLTDHQLDLPLPNFLVVAALASLSSLAPPRAATTLRAPALVALSLLAAGPLFALGRDLLARRAYDESLDASAAADVVAALDRATRWLPQDSFFQHQAADRLLRAGEAAADPARRVALAKDAAARLEAARTTGAHEEFAHYNLGWLHLDLGDPAAAARDFRAAAQLVPDRGGVYFGLGLAWQQLGRRDAAVRAFALEWLDDPRSAFSPAWEVPALAALRPAVRAEAARLYEGLLLAYPPARSAAAWARWWEGQPVAPGELGAGFTAEAAAFAASLSSASPAPASPAPWLTLREAWAARDFARIAPADAAFAAALARRAAAHPDDFRAFLVAPLGDEPSLLRLYRRQRTGAGVLALHPEGPLLTDLFVVQENRLLADFAPGLFPPKGWVPGRFLLALLPPDPR